jgi:cell division protein ZapA (FtsZ GTPase activity inhibitor)
MATLTINDKTYNLDDLGDEAKNLLNNIRYAETKLRDIQSESAVIQTARNSYVQALNAAVEKSGAEPVEKPDAESETVEVAEE